MADSEKAEPSIERENRVFDSSICFGTATDQQKVVEPDLIPSILYPQRNNRSIISDSECWRDVSGISLPLEHQTTVSRFLNPCYRVSYSTCSELTAASTSDRVSPHSDHAQDGQSLRSLSSDNDYRGSNPNSSSLITMSNGRRPPKKVDHRRSESGTQIISGICDALPVFFHEKISPTSKSGVLTISRVSDINEAEKSKIYSSSSDDDIEDDLPTVLNTLQKRKPKAFDKTRRGSELLPPKQMWISGGPCPGLYVTCGRAYGRPKWLGEEAKVCWNPHAKAWLLISKNTKEEDIALAILRVDSNNPCVTAKWRVGRNAKAGIGYSFFDTYAFDVDHRMKCSKYFGSSERKFDSSIVVDSTLVKVKRGIGIVRFVGPLEDQKGMFAGIDLFSPSGLHNGTMKGIFYFEARPMHGIFVRLPGAVKHMYGHVNDKIATLIDELLSTARTFAQISEPTIERLVKILVHIKDCKTLFFKSKLNVLGIILFYEIILQ